VSRLFLHAEHCHGCPNKFTEILELQVNILVSCDQDIGNLQIIGTEVDAERFKSNRRVRILFLATARLLQSPSLDDDDDAATAEELFRNSPTTITRSVKYGTALKIRM
jgi:hypothetical protein